MTPNHFQTVALQRLGQRPARGPVTKASKSSYRGPQRAQNGSSALRGFRKLSLNMPRHPLRSVVWDTGLVTVPRRGWTPNPAVTYPDVSGMTCKLKVFEPLWILSDSGSWVTVHIPLSACKTLLSMRYSDCK